MLTTVVLTAEKERQKAEKAKKLEEKKAKAAALARAATTSKAAKVAKTTEQIPKYVETTPEGEKKGESAIHHPSRRLLSLT